MADATTLKDVVKELKETNKKNDVLLRETGKFQKATNKITGGFLGKLVERTEGVPLLGSVFGNIHESVGRINDGISATGRMIGIGGEETNKRLADIAGMSLKGFKKTEEMAAIEKAKQETDEAVLDVLLKSLKLNEDFTDEQKKLIAAAHPEKQNELLTKMVKQQTVDTEVQHITQVKVNSLLKETLKQGEQNKETAAKRLEAEQDRVRQAKQDKLSMMENLKEIGKKTREASGITNKLTTLKEGGGEFLSNFMGDFLGSASALALGRLGLGAIITSFFASIMGIKTVRLLRVALKRTLPNLLKGFLKNMFLRFGALLGPAAVLLIPFYNKEISAFLKKFFEFIQPVMEMFAKGFEFIITGISDTIGSIFKKLGNFIKGIAKFFGMDIPDKSDNTKYKTNPTTGMRERIAPAGSHLMPDGTIMKDSAMIKNKNVGKEIEENALGKAGAGVQQSQTFVTTHGGNTAVSNQNIAVNQKHIVNPDMIVGRLVGNGI
jgi:hypothetical protein